MKSRKEIFVLLSLSVFPFWGAARNHSVPERKDTAVMLRETVIEGKSPDPVAQILSSIPTTTVEADRIDRPGKSALITSLSGQVPGLFITQRGVAGFGIANGAAGGISMRGIGGSPTTGVLLLIDGHPQYMGIMGHPLPDAYMASDVERVEVVRGPASALYGSNAMGGVINLVTKKQKREGTETSLGAEYGSYNTQKYTASHGGRFGKYHYRIGLNHNRTDGHRPLSDFHLTGANVRLGKDFGEKMRLLADVNISKYYSEDPGTVQAPATESRWADVLRGVASLSLENDFLAGGSLTLFYNFGKHKIYDGFRSDDDNFGVNLRQAFHTWRGNTVTLGFDYKRYGGKARNIESEKQIVDRRVDEIAGYVLMRQYLFKKLSLNAALRYEHNSMFGDQIVPQAGVTYHPWPTTVFKASVDKGYRSPTIREMFSENMGPASNPDLKPEQMMNYQLSYLQDWPGISFHLEATAFFAEGKNMIKVLPVNGRPHYLNTGGFTHAGGELAARWHWKERLFLSGTYSYLWMKSPVVASPVHQGYLSAEYRLKKFVFSLEGQYVGDLYTKVASGADMSEETESYFLLNASVSYRPWKFMRLHLSGENLTDAAYRINYGYPMPGITAFGGVEFNF